MRCPRCRSENQPEAHFCEECGARLELACPACGQPVTAGKKFCRSCGAALTTAGEVAQSPSPQSYTPKYLAEKILTSKGALEGERKQVTVLFADLKGSMELLTDRDPEEARKILDPVLARMMEAVHRYEGTVNQVMGDGIMALFGAPLAQEDHAIRACYSALRMQDAIRRYTEEVRRAEGFEVQIRVGLNSGEVVVRSIGSDLRMDYTAVGQTTHLAARMEQLAPPGTTRLTGETVRLAEGFVKVRPLGPVPVRGVAEPLEVFELLGAAAARTRLQAASGRGFTRFVGRDAETAQMRQAAEQARKGRGQLVAVVGEPGVGKSRLFYEFLQSHHTHGWLVLEASSVSYGKATPFLPLIDLLRSYFRIEDRDDRRSAQAKVTGAVLTLDRALEEAVPAILWLLDALGPEDAFLALAPSLRRQRAIDAVKQVLLRESQVQPVVLVFEDLHWTDAETQGVLDGLVDSLPAAPILLAVNYRPEYSHRWGSKTYYRQLRIDPLAPETADQLLQALLGVDPSIQPLIPLLVARTEGNPLFLEESVRTLAETQALVGEPGAYRLARSPETVQVPATVQAILAARIDRLRPEIKRLLQAASVVGKDVPVALLEAIAELGAEELDRALGELQTAEFLYQARLFPELEYTFKHALTHEVAYGSLLQERRAALHAALVEAIERLHAGRLTEQVEVLAHHAVRGGLTAKAVRYLREAGAKSMARSANREAAGFFEAALALLAELPETVETLSDAIDLRVTLGPALIALKGAGAPEVEALYQRARELVDRLDDASRRFPVLWGYWYTNYSSGRYAEARAIGEQLLAAARRGNDSGRLLEAHHALWATLLAMGQPSLALLHIERGIALYDRERHASQTMLYGNHDPGACCRYQLALSRWLLGYPDQALAAGRDAYRLVHELRHPLTTVITHWFVACIQYQRGERDAAAETTEQLVTLAAVYGFPTWTDAAIVLPHAVGKTRLGPEALAELHRRLNGMPGASWRKVFCLCVLAELYAEVSPEEGLQVLASIGETDRHAFLAPEVFRLEGELRLRSGERAANAAERCFHTAIELARRRLEKSLELRATASLARLWGQQDRRADAHRVLADVYAWFTEGFDTTDLRAAKGLLADLAG